LPNIRLLLDKLNDDQYNLYYFGKKNNPLLNMLNYSKEERILNKEILNQYDGLRDNIIIVSGSKYFNDLVKVQYPDNFFLKIFKKDVVFFYINLKKERGKIRKDYSITTDNILYLEGTVKDDYLIEGKIYYENGKISQEGIFKDGILIEGKKYYENGKISQDGIFKDGILIEGRR
jgi:antitoxin component YwqK of YwqJK toxin-antitoxin module